MNPVHYSTGRDERETPQALFDELNAEFGFVVDAAATAENAKCPAWIPPETDGLRVSWAIEAGARGGAVWCNPPYSKLRAWVAKAHSEALAGATVVCLIPARTDTRAWHEYVWDGANHRPRPGVEVRFLKGRVRFAGMPAGAPFPSAVVVFRGGAQ